MPTTTLPSRRPLHFNRLDEVVADVEKLAAAEKAGQLLSAGKWTLGQTLNHLASWVDYGYDGAPVKLPFFVPWVMRPIRSRVLTRPMPPGRRIPKVAGGTLAIDPVPAAEGLVHFHTAFGRLGNEAPTKPSPLFGLMRHDEWILLHLRHAELHLSFLTIA